MIVQDVPTIRAARPDDAEALARLHVAVWRETYTGVAPIEAIEQLDERRRLPYWRDVLGEGDAGRRVLVACRGDEVMGLVSYGPASTAALGERGEIKHLYVAPACQGMGWGKRLLNRALDDLRASGCRRVGLAVVRENAHARRFYRAMGGREVGEFQDAGPLWRSNNVLVEWA